MGKRNLQSSEPIPPQLQFCQRQGHQVDMGYFFFFYIIFALHAQAAAPFLPRGPIYPSRRKNKKRQKFCLSSFILNILKLIDYNFACNLTHLSTKVNWENAILSPAVPFWSSQLHICSRFPVLQVVSQVSPFSLRLRSCFSFYA